MGMGIIVAFFVVGIVFLMGAVSYFRDQEFGNGLFTLCIGFLLCFIATLTFGCNVGTDTAVQVNMEQVPVKGEVTILINETVTFKDGKRVQINMLSQKKVVGK